MGVNPVTSSQSHQGMKHAHGPLTMTRILGWIPDDKRPDFHRFKDMHDRGDFNETMGHALARIGCPLALQEWISSGGDINARDRDGDTIGHTCAFWGTSDCFFIWCDAGGDIHARDDKQHTIGHRAAGRDQQSDDVFSEWLRRGGDPASRAGDGLSIMDILIGEDIYDARGKIVPWCNHGGCMLDEDHDRMDDIIDEIARHTPSRTDHGIIVTQHCYRIMGYDMPKSPASWLRQSCQTPLGKTLAYDLLKRIKDPVHMALFAQAIADAG
jgi:hypothetical protein